MVVAVYIIGVTVLGQTVALWALLGRIRRLERELQGVRR